MIWLDFVSLHTLKPWIDEAPENFTPCKPATSLTSRDAVRNAA